MSTTPPTSPETATDADSPSRRNAAPTTDPIETCGEAMKLALQAAHSVEIGDYYFGEKNYKGSLLRYQDALNKKPGDLAIYVRLGRAFEKLNQIPQAIEQYKAAQNLSGPEKWTDEAKSASATAKFMTDVAKS